MSAPTREELTVLAEHLVECAKDYVGARRPETRASASRRLQNSRANFAHFADALYACLATLEAERDAARKALADAADAIDGEHLTDEHTIDLRDVANRMRAATAAARGIAEQEDDERRIHEKWKRDAEDYGPEDHGDA